MQLSKLKRSWTAALFAIVALVAISCGDSATATPSPTATSAPAPTATPAPTPTLQTAAPATSAELTAEETAYVEQVQSGWDGFNSKAVFFREVFAQTYSIKSRFFAALVEAGAGTAYESAYQAVKKIDAPPRFQEDQQLMVQTLDELVGHDADIKTAVEIQDLPGFTIANARAAEAYLNMAIELTEIVCRATNAADLPGIFCVGERAVPGGEYGAGLNSVLARFNVGVIARSLRFGPHFTPDDILDTMVVLQPGLSELYDSTVAQIRRLAPPAELETDHELLVEYFATLENSRLTSALQGRDLPAYQEASGNGRSRYCSVPQDFSSDMARIAGFYIGISRFVCGPAA